jgi:glycosyltransferase involved in cell wall biosynthesis
MKPLFSVVIPTYNRALKLKRAIESVLSQSYENFEILVMDDGSTDDTASTVALFRDPRITYKWDQNFGGPAKPRNRGIAIAKGDWICFLDADDWWTTDKLQTCLDCIHDKVDLLYHDLEIVTDKPSLFSRKIIKSWQVKNPVLIDLLMKGNAIVNSSVVVRKSLLEKIGGVDESRDMIASEDYNTWLRIAQVTDRFVYVPRRLGFYLQHAQNISQKDMSGPERRAVQEFLPALNEKQRLKLEAGLNYTKARFHCGAGDHAAARESLLFGIKHGHLTVKMKASVLLFMQMFKNSSMR